MGQQDRGWFIWDKASKLGVLCFGLRLCLVFQSSVFLVAFFVGQYSNVGVFTVAK